MILSVFNKVYLKYMAFMALPIIIALF